MGKKKEYKEANRRFLKKLSFQEGVCALPCGIYYKVLETGESTISPGARSIVTVHYKGSLIDGRVFDNSYERTCPDALRLSDVIEGWQGRNRQTLWGGCTDANPKLLLNDI